MSDTVENGLRHEHCAEGACESCDCCAAGWCINFEDGSPWDDSLAFFKCVTPEPKPGDHLYEHHREAFDLWCEIAVESRGLALRARPIPPGQSAEKVPCTCGASLVTPYPNDTGHHSTTECIDEATGRPIPPGKGDADG